MPESDRGRTTGGRTTGTADPAASFGFREVPAADRQRLVNEVFSAVAERYDLMNDLMSGGLHRLWKDDLVATLNPPVRASAFAHLDVAGGTGDVAFRIAAATPTTTPVIVADLSPEMLAVGERRAREKGLADRVRFVLANAEQLPFPDRSFDAYTIAFGIRNVTAIDKALAEARRVLRIGGHFLCLEFAHVDVPLLDRLYDLHSFEVIPRLGGLVTGSGEPYAYLVESIRRFPRQAAFADMIRAAGLERVSYRNLTGGIAAIHSAWRI